MLWITKVLISLAVIVGGGFATSVRECSSGQLPHAVNVIGCTESPCKLVRGTSIDVEVQFITTEASKSLKPKVVTNFAGISIPYDLPSGQKNGCEHLKDTHCPMDAGEYGTYVLTMPILKIYPLISLEIQLEMFGDSKDSLFCFKIDCEVVGV